MTEERFKVGIAGGGAMGEALVRGLLAAGRLSPAELMVSEVHGPRREYLERETGIRTVAENGRLVEFGDVLILAVKPHVVGDVAAEIRPGLRPSQTVISIAAGVSLEYIEKSLGEGFPVIRVMPNTPALVGAAASAYCLGRYAGPRDGARARTVLEAVGRTVQVEERLLDVVTGLSGSGPAYMFLVLEALADGAVRMGLPRDVSVMLAAQTMYGAAKMVLETGEHTGRLKDMVTTPGGTTAAGLFALEEGAVRAALQRAVEEATARAREINERGGS
ncbi:MAG: pyrroline-5-carboxylate reductase [Bacillota bacterium]